MESALTILLAVALPFLARFSNDPGLLFPEKSRMASAWSAVRESGLASSVTVEFDAQVDGGVDRIVRSVSRFAAEAAARPDVLRVRFRAREDAAPSVLKLAEAFPRLLDPVCLDGIDVSKAVSGALVALSTGSPAAPLRNDPANLKRPITDALSDLLRFAPYRLAADRPFPCDASHRRALVFIEALPEAVVGAEKAAKFLADVRTLAETIVPDAQVTMVSPLSHSIANERAAKGDILRVGVVSALILALVFLVMYRMDWKALWIPLSPLVATLGSALVCLLVFRELSVIVLGIGGGIAGFAVDQGIHVYAAVRGGRGVRGVLRPLLTALLTSVTSFVAVCAADVPLFTQLGVFAALALTFNFLLSVGVLPRLLGTADGECVAFRGFLPSRRVAFVTVAASVLLVALAVPGVGKLGCDFSLTALDGTPDEVCEHESAFNERWANPTQGATVFFEDVEEESLRTRLAALPDVGVIAFLPPRSVMAENLKRWSAPAVTNRLVRLERDFGETCRLRGLPPGFFSPFFAAVRSGLSARADDPLPAVLEAVRENVFRRNGDGVLAVLQTAPEAARRLEAAGLGVMQPNAGMLASAVDECFRPGISRVLLCALVLLVALGLFVYRSPTRLLTVLAPGAVAAVCGFGLAGYGSFRLDMATCVAAAMMSGLLVDYGVFALHCRHADSGDRTPQAMVLSSVTTLAGAAALMAAEHPVVSHIGTVLFFGILFVSLFSLFTMPAVFRLGLVLALVCGCTTTPSPVTDLVALQPSGETRIWQVRLDVLWYAMPLLVAVRVESSGPTFSATGMTPTGTTMFKCTVRNGVETERYVSPVVPKDVAERLFGDIAADLTRVFFAAPCQDGAWPPSHRGDGRWPLRRWTCAWSGRSADGKTFAEAEYVNRRSHCTFTFKEGCL